LPVAALPSGRAAALPAHGRATADTREAGPYDLYLQGRFLESRRTGDGYAGAIACLRRSVDLDPVFAPAWSALGWAYVRQADHGYVPTQAGFESGRDAVHRALALDAGQPEPYTALGWIHLAYDWDWPAAWDALRRALEIDPVNAEALMARGVLEYTLARHDDAPQSFLASLSRDPLRATTYHFIGRNHTNSGRFPQAEAAFRRELELDPGRGAAHFFLGRVLLYQGRLVEAQREMELERDLGWGLFGQAMCLHTAGDDGGSLRALDEARTRFGDVSAYQVGEVHAWRGETDQAFEWLELAFQRRDGGLVDIVGAPSVRSLVADPRYSDLLRRLRLPG
jgi:tetratricopeptide (TPR) repeat protein